MAVNFKTQHVISKAASRSYMIMNEFFEKSKHYSWKLGIYNTAWWIGFYCYPLNNCSFWGKRKITKWMDSYISKNKLVSPTILQSAVSTSADIYHIWVFWWQGEDSMPELVKGCYSQLCSNNSNVVLITKNNIKQYCHIPDFIYDKVEKGDISFTHLSDIARVSLLAEHGGMWVDATCWISSAIPDWIKGLNLVSPKITNAPLSRGWNCSRWHCWCMGTNMKNNPLFVFTRDVFYKFFERNSCFPFYLFQDYLYDYAYRKMPQIRQMIESVPDNNIRWDKLHFTLNKPWSQEEYELMTKDNWVFKLSYKTIWKERCDGQPTCDAKLMKDKRAK